MSRANKVEKVLRVAIRRVEKRWGKGAWSKKDDSGQYNVCLEGAITGGCQIALTPVQEEALSVVRQVIRDRTNNVFQSIPDYNDAEERTKEEILEVLKLALIRVELDLDDDDFLEEVESLLEK